jgi:hypothetical protein
MIKDGRNREFGFWFCFRLIIIFIIALSPIHIKLKCLLIFMTDWLDCFPSKITHYIRKKKFSKSLGICQEYNYQIIDKIMDLFSYYVVFMLLDLPFTSIYFILILLRTIGTGLFIKTNHSKYLYIFPDLFRELLIVSWTLGTSNLVIIATIVIKIIVEIFLHVFHNKKEYPLDKNNNLR